MRSRPPGIAVSVSVPGWRQAALRPFAAPGPLGPAPAAPAPRSPAPRRAQRCRRRRRPAMPAAPGRSGPRTRR